VLLGLVLVVALPTHAAVQYQRLRSFGQNSDIGGITPTGTLLLSTNGWLYGITSNGGSNHVGTLFRFNPVDQDYQVLVHSSAEPSATFSQPFWLVQGHHGVLYGMTRTGGSHEAGILFKLNLDGSIDTVLHSFEANESQQLISEGNDGKIYGTLRYGSTFAGFTNVTLFSVSQVTGDFAAVLSVNTGASLSPLVQDSQGLLYTTALGCWGFGLGCYGSVWSMDTSRNRVDSLHGFAVFLDGDTQDGSQPVGVILGSDGVLYGTTSNGGGGTQGNLGFGYGFGTVFKVNTDGTGYRILRVFLGSRNGPNSFPGDGQSPGRLTEGNDGVLYGTTRAGGPSLVGTLFKLNRDGTDYTILHTFISSGGDGQHPIGSLLEGPDGAFYGVTAEGGDTGGGTLFRVWPSAAPPAIVLQPRSQTVTAAQTVVLTCVVSGNGLAYQWQLNGTNLLGPIATSSNLVLANVTAAQAGKYRLIVSNELGIAVSPIATLTVNPLLLPVTLLVEPPGGGTLKPGFTGTNLEFGRTYKIAAVPARDYLFSNWDGLGPSSNGTLTFVMESNLVLRANFITNPFIAMQGNYNGLVRADAPSPLSSGAFSLVLTRTAKFSGKLQLNDGKIVFTGAFDLSGFAQLHSVRAGQPTLTLTLQLDFERQQAGGSISDNTWTAALSGDRAGFGPSHPASLFAGNYTLVVPGSSDAAILPGGAGVATIAISASGVARTAGSLGDGTAFSQSVPISASGRWPLFLSLYGKKGSAWSWMSLTNPPDSVLTGDPFIWIKRSVGTDQYYPSGFTNSVAALGSKFLAATNGLAGILKATEGTLVLSDGNLPGPSTNRLTVNNNTITIDATDPFALKVALRNGAVSGSFIHPVTHKTTALAGVVLQNQSVARGYFRGTNQSGSLTATFNR
jgi:uncharacterized repeat protein (TIGR03803 family)